MDGISEVHSSFETCPYYHNLTVDECKVALAVCLTEASS